MKRIATALTVLLAILLSVRLPAAVEDCCLPQPKCAGCCADECGCHVSAPRSSESPAAPTPATLAPVPHLWWCEAPKTGNPCRPAPSPVTVIPNCDETGPPRLFLLTHSFLI
jgi:hypothetical protein